MDAAPVAVKPASGEHLEAWASMRAALWADATFEEHRDEIEAMLGDEDGAAFMAISNAGEAIGFAEAALRHDHVNGCETSPVVFLEGIYVRPAHRRAGVAAALLQAVEAWGRALGCSELGSDTDWENADGQAFHDALGFEETERVIFFRKLL